MRPLNPFSLTCLRIIRNTRDPFLTVAQLAERMKTSQQGVEHAVSPLVRRNLVERLHRNNHIAYRSIQ